MNRKKNPVVLFLATFLAVAILMVLLKSLDRIGLPESGGPVATQPDDQGRDRLPPSSPADASLHLTMGNPSGATDDPSNRDNYLMRKPYFALSYHNAKGTPNWVSWCLQKSDLGSAPRVQFVPDLDLPGGFKRILPSDYTGSGFDRGHLCPHSDRASTPEAARATFVMTNMVPQAPACNQKAWADLEDYCRHLLNQKERTLYVVAGPQGQGGTGTKGPAELIGKHPVTVPARCWKIVLVLDGGTGGAEDVGRVRSDTRLIAVVMPNEQSVGHVWAKYRTSAQEVETLTGYRFFDRVPAEVIDPLKAKVDREPIPASRHRRTED